MNHTPRALIRCTLLTCLALLAGCQTTPARPPLRTVERVELQRFMGDWYVIAHIPTFIEKGAYNAVESYRLNGDGTIATTFTFNKDALDGPLKKYTPTGFVRNTATNAEWAMQFVWPVKAQYKIVYLDDNYQQTVVARDQRDYVWILARTPRISPTDYEALVTRIRSIGYDINLLRRVPHQD